MVTTARVERSAFFFKPVRTADAARPLAAAIIERARTLRPGVALYLSDRALPVRVADLTEERLLRLVPAERLPLAQGIVDAMHHLGAEVGEGNYYLNTLLDEISSAPPFAQLFPAQFRTLDDLRGRGVKFADLPQRPGEAREAIVEFAQRGIGISIEYLLGNLEKAFRLMRLLGVRQRTVNMSGLFHNFNNGFFEADLSTSAVLSSADILARAVSLRERGVHFEIFLRGEFNRRMAGLAAEELDRAITQGAEANGVSEELYRRFIARQFEMEDARLAAAPEISITQLLACFKFSQDDEEQIAVAPVPKLEDPTRWKATDLGKACAALKRELSWESFAAGVKIAGDYDEVKDHAEVTAAAGRVKALADGYQISLSSGRGGKVSVSRIRELSDQDVIFDLYCIAVIEQKTLREVLATAEKTLSLIRDLDNRDPIVILDEIVTARLRGESYATLLGTSGIVLRDSPVALAMERLRALGDKVEFTVQVDGGDPVPLREAGVDQFRRAVILMGRRFREPHSPERVLAAIADRIVPEISALPAEVVDRSRPHDLGEMVELAIAGVPARYPLRRPWTRVDSDLLSFLGSGLEPGIRNCLGCPVNVLYGHVLRTAVAMGYLDITTYEATGCFEVYSGIWPYTGKKVPTLHGVFGAAPSEMLGGMAAKRARVRYALKLAQQIAETMKVLHLGWGGDGGTFDIGFGNLSGLFSRLQKLVPDDLAQYLVQRALYVCYDNEGYQNTGGQYSAATAPGVSATTYPRGELRPAGNDLRKKPIVEIVADHGVSLSARMNIHRPEHIARVTARALEDGERGAFLHFLQPCTTGWKFNADNIAYDLSILAEDGGLFPPVTIEHGVAYLEVYPTRRDPAQAFMQMQSRFAHLTGGSAAARKHLGFVMAYYQEEWQRNLRLTGYEGEVPQSDRFRYLEPEHRRPRFNVLT